MRARGCFLVRIEDIDSGRCRPHFVARQLDDLRWLSLDWEEPVIHQSQRMDNYAKALERLRALGLTYPCFCTRAEIKAEIAAAGAAPHTTAPDGAMLYPGTCRTMSTQRRQDMTASGRPYAIRLDIAAARRTAGSLTWNDRIRGRQTARPEQFGDVIIARKDVGTSYHLAVVVDDAAQGVTQVTRGMDLFEASHLHRLLYALLDLPVPDWHHHPLVRNAAGRRLAKRDADTTLRSLRAQGHSPDKVLAQAIAAAS